MIQGHTQPPTLGDTNIINLIQLQILIKFYSNWSTQHPIMVLVWPHATNTFYYYRSYLELLCQRYSTLPPGGRLQPNILLWSYQTLQLTYRKLNSSQRNKLKLEIFNISLNPLTMIRISQVFLLSQNLTDRFTA